MPNEKDTIAQGNPLPVDVTIGSFFAIACYNTIEILFLMFTTFRRKNTLYFWSMLVCCMGILIQEISASLRVLRLAPNMPMAVIASLGWWMMTTGQSLVLYSRLHLVISCPHKLRWILVIIATTFFTVQLPTSITFIGMNAIPKNKPDIFTPVFDVLKIIQLAAFTLQESALSGLYIYAFKTTSNPLRIIRESKVRNMLRQMIGLFLLVVALDVTLMVTEYIGYFQIQTTLKPAVYSIKLKAELFVLNNLVNLVQTRSCCCWNSTMNQSPLTQDSQDRISDKQISTPQGDIPWLRTPNTLPGRRATMVDCTKLSKVGNYASASSARHIWAPIERKLKEAMDGIVVDPSPAKPKGRPPKRKNDADGGETTDGTPAKKPRARKGLKTKPTAKAEKESDVGDEGYDDDEV
ncbi:hypothetical protein F5Y13DRAFT_191143 [Hypoxylon sp. FL1857]|nr:hypothetical protein F5Y13DRAFT_191143 [Hypoxylon sp. FL1857]